MNRSTGKSPFQIVNGRSPRVVDLISAPKIEQKNADVESFAEHMNEIHDQVQNKIQKSSQKYKEKCD